jgi:hypothetical protein
MSPETSLQNALMLAKAAKAYGMPTFSQLAKRIILKGRLLLRSRKHCQRHTKTESNTQELSMLGQIRISAPRCGLPGARSSSWLR